uniref:FMRFamide-like neuropeptide AF7 n=1 Tax=Ascaris suum TaxID=6253 RepID=FAR7_ASCSU|nr:RecName: Full=FMRFamide-like neuropeptide AF7 [Ascaris suum]
AGPRFIRF